MSKPLSGLEILADRGSIASDNAFRARNAAKDKPTPHNRESKGYYEGKAAAYANAHEVMKAELERLKNRFQNGSLNIDDFGV